MEFIEDSPHVTCGAVQDRVDPLIFKLLIVFVALWLLCMFYAFWWFEFRLIQPFDPEANKRAVFFDGEQTMQQLANVISSETFSGVENNLPIATVVHFWDPDCPCNKLNESHVNNIISEYGEQGVKFVIVTKNEAGLKQAKDKFSHAAVIEYKSNIPHGLTPPSSPAAVVMNSTGQANYFGPYSIGALCLTRNGAFVETILDSLFKGENRIQINTAAIGCFCSWDNNV